MAEREKCGKKRRRTKGEVSPGGSGVWGRIADKPAAFIYTRAPDSTEHAGTSDAIGRERARFCLPAAIGCP